MAMNTTVNTGNVGQVGQIAPTIKSNQKVVTGDSLAGFQPETQVELESSIKSMLASLEKSVLGKGTLAQGLPEEVRKMVETLMKNAFSLETSLSQGLSDVMQSQKFSLDQLQVLSKLLDQIGSLLENGSHGKLPEALRILLGNINLSYDGEGKSLDGMLLNKLAYQLLEGKNLADLPESLQFLLMNNVTVLPANVGQNTEMTFLKQLVQFFMSPSKDDSAAEQPTQAKNPSGSPQGSNAQQSANTAQTAQPQGQQQTAQGSSAQQSANTAQTAQPQGQQQAAQSSNAQQSANTAQTTQPQGQQQTAQGSSAQQSANTAQTAQPQGQQQTAQGANAQQSANTAQTTQPQGQQQTAQSSNAQQSANTAQTAQPQGQQQTAQGSNVQQSANTAQTAQPQGQQQTAQGSNAQQSTNTAQQGGKQQNGGMQSSAAAPQTNNVNTASSANARKQSVFQNTEQATQSLKNLAGQLLKGNTLAEHEVNLLRNFINGNQKMLSEQEAKQLQTLIRMSEENIPASVRQAAMKQDLPNLPKLWAFVQLCNLTRLLDLQTERLRKAGKDINDFTLALKKSMGHENEVNGNQRSMSFMMPLYLGDNEKCYPTYIHVYHESPGTEEDEEEKKETWLRLCLLTENIGAVEIVFRVYEKNNVNLRVAFSDQDTVESFYDCIPDLRRAFNDLPLVLNDVKVSAIGE